MDPYEDVLDQLSEEDLINFIKKRAELLKLELQQSRDKTLLEKETISSVRFELEQMVKEKENKVKYVSDIKKSDTDQIRAMEKANQEYKSKIEKKRAQFKEKIEPIKKQYQEMLDNNIKDINPKDLDKICKFFEKKSNEVGIFIFENLVALLRTQNVPADNYSVELYIKKYEGFLLALERLDPKDLDRAFCEDIIQKLTTNIDKKLMEEQNIIFKPYRSILAALCRLGTLGHDESKHEKAIEDLEENIRKNEREIDQKKLTTEQDDIQRGFQEDLEYYKSQLDSFKEKERKINEELKEIESKLFDFENQYFAGI